MNEYTILDISILEIKLKCFVYLKYVFVYCRYATYILILYILVITAVLMAKLVLEDGTEIIGDSFGHNSASSGEIGNTDSSI